MIYLDNSATTYPKPQIVYQAVNEAMRIYGANPGRGGYRMSIKSAEKVYNCREAVANLYNIENAENIIFTQNCTYALNTVIKGFLKDGDNVVISNMEHNSVLRPLKQLESRNITFNIAEVIPDNDEKTIDNFRKAINEKTTLMVITHASNVTGTILPIRRLTALAHHYGIKVLIDAAQSSGVIPIDAESMNFDFLASAGHKGLMGPMGTGILYIKDIGVVEPLVCGGTGSGSLEMVQPSITPDKYESGTCNVVGICGLLKGIQFINNIGVERIYKHEFSLLESLYKKLSQIPNLVIYTEKPKFGYNAPLLSFNIKDVPSERVAEILDSKFNIAVRAGLHCSPLMHKTLHTEEQGAVRISLSYFNNINHINTAANAIKNIAIFYSKNSV